METKMNAYVPFKDIKEKYPTLTLHKLSKNINVNDIGNLGTTIFFEDGFKDDYKQKILPSELMHCTTALVVNEIFYNFLIKIGANIGAERACYIDAHGEYHEDFWVVKPNIKDSIISLKNSIYTERKPTESFLKIINYKFKKIALDPSKDLKSPIYWDPYIKTLIITEEVLNFIKNNKLKGLSFIEVEKYDLIKTIYESKDHIIIAD